MKYRSLGHTGLQVSEIAFGGVSIGIPYANQPLPTAAESLSLLHESFDQGINFYDTARMYGESETRIGEAFRGRQEEVIIATKAVHFLQKDGSIPKFEELNHLLRRSLEESLKALRRDYIDVFMLHQANLDILQNQRVKDIFSTLQEEGKIRFVGASIYSPEEGHYCIESGFWDVIQMPMNILDQRNRETMERAHAAGIGIMIRSVLFRGMLAGDSVDLHPDLKNIVNHIDRLREWNINRFPDLYNLAVKYILSYPAVSAALVGMDRLEHLGKAVEVADGHYLSEEWRSELEKMAFDQPELLDFNQWIKKGWVKN